HALSVFKSASLVVTGRHHGVYLSAMAGTPFIAFGSNTWKVEGTLELFSKSTGEVFSLLSPQNLNEEEIEQAQQENEKFYRLRERLKEKNELSTFYKLSKNKRVFFSRERADSEPELEPEHTELAKGVVLAVNCVPTEVEPGITGFLENLSVFLAQQGKVLIVASTAPIVSDTLNIIELPYNVTDYEKYYIYERADLEELNISSRSH